MLTLFLFSSPKLSFFVHTRAERCCCALHESGQLNNPEIIIYLNRLSDTLWLLARWAEGRAVGDAPGAGATGLA